jgi:hypothetical protein
MHKSLWLAVLLLVMAQAALAHHSRVMYEPMKTVTLKGTVKEFSWANPHSWLYIMVLDERGQAVEWVLEGSGAGQLARQGWRPDSLKVGDPVSVTLRPMKDGSHAGLLGTATLADGRSLSYRP